MWKGYPRPDMVIQGSLGRARTKDVHVAGKFLSGEPVATFPDAL